MQENNRLKGVIEALLLVSEKPLLLEQVKEVLEGIDVKTIQSLIQELKVEYENRKSGISIIEIAGGYQMCTSSDYASYLKKFYNIKHKERLSTPSLETLAIIAYKQPLTRLEIEVIRGVNVDGVIRTLLEKGLIRITGRKDALGRPFVYGTTRQFLDYFGLKSLDELPKVEEFSKLATETEAKIATETETEEAKDATENTSQEDR